MIQGKSLLHSFACGYPIVPGQFVGETVPSLLNCLDNIVENQLTVYVIISGLSSVPLVCISVLTPIQQCFFVFPTVF